MKSRPHPLSSLDAETGADASARHSFIFPAIKKYTEKYREQILAMFLAVGINGGLIASVLASEPTIQTPTITERVSQTFEETFTSEQIQAMSLADAIFERERILLSDRVGTQKAEEIITEARGKYRALVDEVKVYSKDHTPTETMQYLTDYFGVQDNEQPLVSLLLTTGKGSCRARSNLGGMVVKDIFPAAQVHAENGFVTNKDGSIEPHVRTIAQVGTTEVALEIGKVVTAPQHAQNARMVDLVSLAKNKINIAQLPHKLDPALAGRKIKGSHTPGVIDLPPPQSLFTDVYPVADSALSAEVELARISKLTDLNKQEVVLVTLEDSEHANAPQEGSASFIINAVKTIMPRYAQKQWVVEGNHRHGVLVDSTSVAHLPGVHADERGITQHNVYVGDDKIQPEHLAAVKNVGTPVSSITFVGKELSSDGALALNTLRPNRELDLIVDSFDPDALAGVAEAATAQFPSIAVTVLQISPSEIQKFADAYEKALKTIALQNNGTPWSFVSFNFLDSFTAENLQAFAAISTPLTLSFPQNSITTADLDHFLRSAATPELDIRYGYLLDTETEARAIIEALRHSRVTSLKLQSMSRSIDLSGQLSFLAKQAGYTFSENSDNLAISFKKNTP